MPVITDTVIAAAPLVVVADALDRIDPSTFPAAALNSATVDAASASDFDPGVPEHDDSAGVLAGTSLDDWYYRIHLIPGAINFGNMVGDQQRTISLWNAYFEPKTVSAYALTGDPGVVITGGPTAAPFDMDPLQEFTYTADVSIEGSPLLFAEATWTIDGTDYTTTFLGNRVVLFPFRPNWNSPVEESIEFGTALGTSYTGKEQISEYRDQPRRLLQYTFQLRGNDANRFDNIIFCWAGRLFGVPLWHEKTKLQTAVNAGDTALTADTTYRTFEPGSSAVLYVSPASYEVVEIATVAPGGVTLANGLIGAWPAGTRLYPIMVAAPAPQISTSRRVDTTIEGVIRFTSHPATLFDRLPATAAPMTYRGVEVYLGRFNWSSPLTIEAVARQKTTDFGTGIFSVIRRASWPLITRGYRWLFGSRAESEALREFFGRRRGRLKPVWMPSGVRDFVMTEMSPSSATTIYVEPNEYDSMLAMHVVRRDIIIQLRNGTNIMRRIVSAGVDEDGRGVLSLDATLGTDVHPDNVKRISYLGYYRLASDTVTFSWRTDRVSQVESNFILKDPT
jgi:hypothetical protein